ncbi:MAG TPA: STT3 domain-containing protein [Candidatus Nanoarchaeia archaeon]|nr:STT3 domain-containing protein [Candidatus Nanoarchaeia archaeon]
MSESSEKHTTDEKEAKEIVEKRKEKLASVFKIKISYFWNIIIYIILAFITFIAVFIRTRNINNLKDITTGTWTLGPDLDPFLFLRWAEYIVEHGKLMIIDNMRYIPLGYNTAGEGKLLSYLIAWFYQILSIFNSEVSITYAAIIFPVFMFALTCIAFFFLVRKIFENSFENKYASSTIALISTLFLAILPEILPRTIAGIPEKEAAGFLFIFLVLYFFICSFKSKDYLKSGIFGGLAGISTALLGLIWGGVTFVFATISLSVFVFFMLGLIDKKRFVGYFSWVILFAPIAMIFSTRYSLYNLLTSTTTIPIFALILLIAFDLFLYDKITIFKKINDKYKIPRQITSLVLIGLIGVILSILIFGIDFISYQINDAFTALLKPLSANRFTVTVAENRQPYFSELTGSFGPVLAKIALYFWLFIIGSCFLFYNMIKKFEFKDRISLTLVYFISIICLMLSKYSPNSQLNGESGLSLMVYFGGIILFLGWSLFLLYKYNKNSYKEGLKIDFGYIVIFTLFFVSILAARSGVRFIMMLVPPTSAIVGYFVVSSVLSVKNKKDETNKIIAIILAIIVVLAALFSAFSFYNYSKSQASGFYPSVYNWQWQKAMDWVRNNTEEDAVFAHWWDYGYWVQSIGKRATVLDGGNAIVYWNYLMGRHVLTTPDDRTALEFLYTHNSTHLLIDSTDIGKYSAFSSIGSDENYDRLSYIPTFVMDARGTRETSNGLSYVYTGGSGLDDDIIWEENGTKTFFAKETSVIGGFVIDEIIENNNSILKQPEIIFIQRDGTQVNIPLKYLYYKNKLYNFNTGLNSGVFIVETIQQSNNQIQVNDKGALLFLSERTVDGLLVRKYLFEEEGNFKLVHSEPNLIIADLRNQGLELDDFVYYQGSFLGPIKIWEINYPQNIKFNPDYLVTEYPDEKLKEVGR